MERAIWTDARIDDLVDNLHRTLDRLATTTHELREEMRGMRQDMQAEFREVRGDIASMRRQMTTAALGLCGTFGAIVVALIVHGL